MRETCIRIETNWGHHATTFNTCRLLHGGEQILECVIYSLYPSWRCLQVLVYFGEVTIHGCYTDQYPTDTCRQIIDFRVSALTQLAAVDSVDFCTRVAAETWKRARGRPIQSWPRSAEGRRFRQWISACRDFFSPPPMGGVHHTFLVTPQQTIIFYQLDINSLTYLFTLSSTRVLDEICAVVCCLHMHAS